MSHDAILVVTTHLHATDAETRVAQVDQMRFKVEKLRQLHEPALVFVCGDFVSGGKDANASFQKSSVLTTHPTRTRGLMIPPSRS